MKPNPIALIIDPDRATRRLLQNVLSEYKVLEADTGTAGLSATVEERPDVILLELELPDMDGVSVLRRIRQWCLKPVLILSECTVVARKVEAFECGADDYVTKPFDNEELLARIAVIQRHALGLPASPLLVNGQVRIDLSCHEVTIQGQKLEFTPTEEALFYLLAHHAGKTVTCEHLTRCIWGLDVETKTRDIRVYIANLRRKLGRLSREILIRTEGGVGYCLVLAGSYGEKIAAMSS